MRIASRTEWGGPAAAIGAAYAQAMTAVTVHNTYRPALPASATVAQERAAVAGIQRTHRDVNGWAGIGYGHLIFQSGRIYEGRGWGRIGAHAGTAAGNRTHGVVFVIDGETTAPSSLALASFAWLRAEGVRLGHLTAAHGVRLHSDWKATACPGRYVTAAVRALPRPAPASAARVTRRNDSGPHVRAVQDMLVAMGYMTAAQVQTGPGQHGPQTEAALAAFVDAHT